LAANSNLRVRFINRLVNVQLSEVSKKIDGLEEMLATDANAMEDYKIQEIYLTVKTKRTLEERSEGDVSDPIKHIYS